MKRYLLTVYLAFLTVSTSLAQELVFKGTVVDDENGNPIKGASVRVKGNDKIGVSTDLLGIFSLKIPKNTNSLIITAMGYKPFEVGVGKSNLTIRLSAAVSELDELVVTGYGVQRKRDVIGATARISGKDLEQLPTVSIDKGLQGRAAGVLVQANNGIPGGAINVRIRGQGSLSAGNSPLYVVDGVQLNSRIDGNITQSNPLAFISNSDIESIDFLKDAAAAAIYGSQGANGVVIITTKKGKAGKTTFSFNSFIGTVSPLKTFKVLNAQEWVNYRAEAYNNRYGDGFEVNQQYVLDAVLRIPNAANMTPDEVNKAISELKTYDWQKAIFQSGVIQNYELNAQGGNQKTKFYLSGSYNLSEAILNKVDFRRGTFRANISNKTTDKLSLNAAVNLSTFSQQAPYMITGTGIGSPAFSASLILPSNRIYNEDGSYYGLPGSGQIFPGILNQNVVAINDYSDASQTTNQAIGNFSATYELIKNMFFKSFFGLDYKHVQGRSYRDPRTNDGYNRGGFGSVFSNQNTNFITSQTLNYQKSIEKHAFDGLLGFEYKSEVNYAFSGSGDGYPSPAFRYLNAAANPLEIGEFTTQFKRISGFGRLGYQYNSTYLATLTMRYDGSSRFGANNKFGFFPSLQLGWNLHKEFDLKPDKYVDELKLRASYGQTGNDQIGNFPSLGLYGSGSVYAGVAGIAPVQLPNPNLKWERNVTINFGLDYSFFKSRIDGSIDFYRRMSNDLLVSQPLQSTSGFSSFISNVGQVRNQGVELELNTWNIKAKKKGDIAWRTKFNFAYNQNKVTRLFDGVEVLPGNQSIRVGYPIGTYFTQKYAGVAPATGRAMFYDINKNLTYNPSLADRVALRSRQPKYYGGFNNTISYKGFDLDFLFQYEYGRVVSDGQISFLLENGRRNFNVLRETYYNRWTSPGQITSFPRLYDGVNEPGSGNPQGGNRDLRRSDYIRLKNVILSYNFEPKLLSRLRINSLKIFVQGTNIFTYDDYWGYDPEWYGETSTGIVPQSKNYTFGIQVGF